MWACRSVQTTYNTRKRPQMLEDTGWAASAADNLPSPGAQWTKPRIRPSPPSKKPRPNPANPTKAREPKTRPKQPKPNEIQQPNSTNTKIDRLRRRPPQMNTGGRRRVGFPRRRRPVLPRRRRGAAAGGAVGGVGRARPGGPGDGEPRGQRLFVRRAGGRAAGRGLLGFGWLEGDGFSSARQVGGRGGFGGHGWPG